MENEEYLKILHEEILNILDEIVRICDKNGFKYYLIGGTLLGAVRHEGFIPWDDDLDIAMPRDDFDAFIDICNRELSSDFKLEWITTNPNYDHVFAKVCRKSTLFEEEISASKTSKRGIFVDIFPLDKTTGYTKKLLFQKKVYNLFNMLLQQKSYQDEISGLNKMILCLFNKKTLHRITTSIMTLQKKSNGDYYSNFGSQYNIKRQTHPIANFGVGTNLSFDGRKYSCPINYENVLISIFGTDYMSLPPIDKRKTHYPVKVIFSDGKEIIFGKTENKVFVGKD